MFGTLRRVVIAESKGSNLKPEGPRQKVKLRLMEPQQREVHDGRSSQLRTSAH